MRENIIGKKFGKLTVKSYHSRKKGYLCRCDCGGETKVRAYELKSGKQVSCICGKKIKNKKPNHISAKKQILKNYKLSAKKRNIDFFISEEHFYNLILQNCYYCGQTPNTKSALKAHKDFFHNGIDRKNNNLGYTNENCVSCCKICNNSKASLSLEDWLFWLERLYIYQNKN